MSGNRYLPWRALPLVAALVVSLILGSSLHAATYTYNSANWSGYVVGLGGTGSDAQSGAATYVSGSWTVPTAMAPLNPSASGSTCHCGVWVGLDGFNDSQLEQLGTDSVYNAKTGVTSYYAWWEMPGSGFLTSGINTITSFNPNPGDSITASVQYNPPGDPGMYLLSITDNTLLGLTGSTLDSSFSTLTSLNASAPRSSAEWIAEAPNFGGIVPLPDVGSVTFTGATATLGSESGPIDNPDWALVDVLLKSSSHTTPPYVNTPMIPGPIVDTGSDGSATSSFVINQLAPEPPSAALAAATAAITGGIAIVRRRRRAKR